MKHHQYLPCELLLYKLLEKIRINWPSDGPKSHERYRNMSTY